MNSIRASASGTLEMNEVNFPARLSQEKGRSCLDFPLGSRQFS